MELTLGSETSAFKTQTPGNNPEDCILYQQQGESLKSTTSINVNLTASAWFFLPFT
jgi:hypothetical protein